MFIRTPLILSPSIRSFSVRYTSPSPRSSTIRTVTKTISMLHQAMSTKAGAADESLKNYTKLICKFFHTSQSHSLPIMLRHQITLGPTTYTDLFSPSRTRRRSTTRLRRRTNFNLNNRSHPYCSTGSPILFVQLTPPRPVRGPIQSIPPLVHAPSPARHGAGNGDPLHGLVALWPCELARRLPQRTRRARVRNLLQLRHESQGRRPRHKRPRQSVLLVEVPGTPGARRGRV